MTSSQARDAINGAAIVVAGIYFYRKLIEPTVDTPVGARGRSRQQPKTISGAAGQIVGVGPLASTGRFVVGFGFTFLCLSLVEGASPDLAGYFAMLIALGAILGNGQEIAADISGQLNEKDRALSKLGIAGEPNLPTVRVAAWEPTGAGMPTGPRTSPGSTRPKTQTV